MSDIDTTLLPDFLAGTREHLDEIEAMLIKLGENPESEEIVRDLFKPMHTIKGSAQFIGLVRIALLAHHMEDLLDLLRQDVLQVTPAIMDILMDGRDRIASLVSELEQSQEEHSSVDDLIEKLAALMAHSHIESDNVDKYTSDEEADQELFQVFIDNLQQRVCEIKARSTQYKSGDNPAEQLAACNIALDNLISSANYMGYESLVADLRAWKTESDAAAAQLRAGNEVSFDFMDSRVDWIIGAYPQIAPAVMLADDSWLPGMDDMGDTTAEVMAAFGGDAKVDTDVDEPISGITDAEAEAVSPEASAEEEEEEVDIEYELLGDFITEAVEHLEEIEALLLRLSNDLDNIDILNDIFRPIHTIKGGAQFIGLTRIAKLSHRMEDLLDLMRRGERASSTQIIDTLIDGRDRIAKLTRELETGQREESPVSDLVDRLTVMIDGGEIPVAETAAAEVPSADTPISEDVVMAGNITLSGDDISEEESDQELFGIFLDQMQEKATSITAKMADLPIVSDPAAVLAQCRQDVTDLKSSANYMGYEKLNQFYQSWLQAIDHTRDELSAGIKASFDFMADHMNELAGMFPQIKQDTGAQQAAAPTTVAVLPEPVSATDTEAAEEEALFNKLSSALDKAMVPASEAEHVETLHDVFEEMLSGKEVDTRAALEAVKQDVLLSKAEKPEPEPEPQLPERRDEGRRGEVEERRQEERRTGERVYKKSIRVDADKIDALMNQVGELVVDRSFFFQLFNEMRDLQNFLKESAGLDQREIKQVRAFTYRLGEAIAGFGRTTNELQEGVMRVRMLPISQLFNRYPRLLRDLTHNTDKKVRLEVSGEDTELDKMVVEELGDPLIHIIRNAVDHGLEATQQRQQAGKDETGTLMLDAYQEGNHIVIDVIDDGRGIDPEKIKAKALSSGLHTQEELDQMTEDEVINLIMSAGFSTAEKITGTSGRGVGMDVVKTNVEKLNGTLEIDSEMGKGTRMRLKIPLTLAIIPALMIRVGENMFTIPLANVEETLHIRLSDTTTIEGTEVIHLRGQTLPIFHLTDLFNLESTATEDGTAFVVVVNTGDQQIGFAVDELMGQEEVVIKPLVDYLQERTGFSGATIIGDGRISLILDIYALVKLTAERQANRQQQLAARRRALSSGNAVESSAHL